MASEHMVKADDAGNGDGREYLKFAVNTGDMILKYLS